MESLSEHFKQQGFCTLNQVISDQGIQAIFQQCETVIDEAYQYIDNKPSKKLSLDEKYLYLKTHYPEIKSHVYDLLKYLDSIQKIPFNHKLQSLVKSLVGNTTLISNISVRIDDATNDRQLPFHQEGLGQISLQGINIWIPLIDVNEQTGTLQFIPESHLNGYVPHQFYPELNHYHGIQKQYINPSQAQHAQLKKGDALLFHPCLFHGTAPMIKPNSLRWTIVIRVGDIHHVPYLQHKDNPLTTQQIDTSIQQS